MVELRQPLQAWPNAFEALIVDSAGVVRGWTSTEREAGTQAQRRSSTETRAETSRNTQEQSTIMYKNREGRYDDMATLS